MPSNNDKYKQEALVLKIANVRTKFLELKGVIYDPTVRHQVKIPSKKDLINMSTVFTKAKDHAIRLSKLRDKKEDKASGKVSPSKLRVVVIDDTLAEYLELRQRGFKQERMDDGRLVWAYPDTLVTSAFTNSAVANNLQNGKEIKLDGPAGERFKKLFLEDLKMKGSGPTVKYPDGSEDRTSVLDANGVQINPFHMNKHMFVFARHYPPTSKNVGGKYTQGREVISRDDHPSLYLQMEDEHSLLTDKFKVARKKYKSAQEQYTKTNAKKDKATQIGDRTITDSIYRTEADLRSAKKDYIALLQQYRISYSLN